MNLLVHPTSVSTAERFRSPMIRLPSQWPGSRGRLLPGPLGNAAHPAQDTRMRFSGAPPQRKSADIACGDQSIPRQLFSPVDESQCRRELRPIILVSVAAWLRAVDESQRRRELRLFGPQGALLGGFLGTSAS